MRMPLPPFPDPARRVAARRNLWIGVAASLALHALVLTLRFGTPEPPPRPTPPRLEVVLLNFTTPDRPTQVQALAQTAAAGGGDADAGLASSPLPAWTDAAQLPTPAATPAPAQATAADPHALAQRELLTQAADAAPAVALTERATVTSAPPAPAAPRLEPADQATLARLTQQYAAISQRLHDAGQRPRQHYFAPSTSPWPFAEYVEHWRAAVESWGNHNYPPQLRGRLYGSLQMTVRIRADGSVAGIEFDTPSIHPELNEAARLIVQRAAPFAPFPDAVRREADVLSITRTWHFENDVLTTQAP